MRVELNGKLSARARPQRGALLPRVARRDVALHPRARGGRRRPAIERPLDRSGGRIDRRAAKRRRQASCRSSRERIQYVVREPYTPRGRPIPLCARAHRAGREARAPQQDARRQGLPRRSSDRPLGHARRRAHDSTERRVAHRARHREEASRLTGTPGRFPVAPASRYSSSRYTSTVPSGGKSTSPLSVAE